MFLPYAAGVLWLLDGVPFFEISSFYWTVPLLLFAYAAHLWRGARQLAQGMIVGGLILSLSITLRSLDMVLCPYWPTGPHFLWHILNAIMLAWMIEVYLRYARRVSDALGFWR